jgi:hypothetical protein
MRSEGSLALNRHCAKGPWLRWSHIEPIHISGARKVHDNDLWIWIVRLPWGDLRVVHATVQKDVQCVLYEIMHD